MKSLALFVLVLFPFAAQAANTICGSDDNSVFYVHKDLKGTKTLEQGAEIAQILIFKNGNVVSESIAFEGQEAKLGPVNPDFSERKDLQVQTGATGTLTIFTAKLTLSKNAASGEDVSGMSLPETHSMVCQTFLAK